MRKLDDSVWCFGENAGGALGSLGETNMPRDRGIVASELQIGAVINARALAVNGSAGGGNYSAMGRRRIAPTLFPCVSDFTTTNTASAFGDC